jgi:fructokinase
MRIGIDLGGTKITAIAIDDSGRECFRQRIQTPPDYAGLIQSLQQLVYKIEASLGCSGTVGFGTPGSISSLSGTMKNCNSSYLNGKALKQDIETVLGREVRLANDANCFALSEATDGVAKGADVVFGVILGTGVGGGIVVNRHSLVGPNSIAGEWGHNPLPDLGVEFDNDHRACYCGRENCIETYLSGPGLSISYEKHSGQILTALDIARAAASGEQAALKMIELYQRQLAAALSVVINIVDPDVVVLGGGVSNISSLYSVIPELWKSTIFSDRVETQLLPAQYGDDSGVRGAAWLWND